MEDKPNDSKSLDEQKSKLSQYDASKAGSRADQTNSYDGADLIPEEELIKEEERVKCLQVFKRLSKNTDFITVEAALVIAKSISDDHTFPEQDIFTIIDAHEVSKNRRLTINDFFTLIEEIKRRQNRSNEEDTKLAYVAMGGQEDGGGFVDANKLIQIIKNDFEMTIDIENLIQEIDEDGSGAIEYGEFNTLLNNN